MSDKASPSSELELFAKIRNLFKRKRKINIGDLGVYEDVLSFTSISNTSRVVHYDVFIKVKAVEVYEELVEVEVLDVTISESASEEMTKFVKHETLRYLKPSSVKWQVEK